MEGTPFSVNLLAAEAAAAIHTAVGIAKTSGMIKADGRGNATRATPGSDYGYPLLVGNGAPTANTVAELGQHYFDIAARTPPYEYVCVGFTAGGFTWQSLGSGTSTLFTFRGFFLSLEDVAAAVTNPQPGDYVGVGTTADYVYYVYDPTQAEPWISIGSLEGEPGIGIPPHGSVGQVLGKTGADDYSAGWIWVAQSGSAPTGATAADFVGQILATPNGAYVCTNIGETNEWIRLARPPRVWNNVVVLASAWVSTSDSVNYPWRAAIALDGVTVNHYVHVNFGETERNSGIFSEEVRSYDGGVYLYAASQPQADFLLATIKAEEVDLA